MTSFFGRWAVVCSILLTQACTTLGPDYVEPQVDWLQSWEAEQYGQAQAAATGQPDLSSWWNVFNDPLLNQLIETARVKNPGLRIAGLRIAESRALLGIATGSQYPQYQQANGSLARINSGESGGEHQQFNNYDLGFDVAWEADFWGKYRRAIESADAAFFASVTNQQNVQVILAAQVTQLYFSYRTTTKQIEIAKMNADLQQRSYDITGARFSSGQDSELDLQQAKAQYLATKSSIPTLEIAQRQIKNALGALLGRAPGQFEELTAEVQELPVLESSVVESVPAGLLISRPDIRTAALQVAAQSAQVGIAETDIYPSISLFGTIGWSGNSLADSSNATNLAFGPSFTWNVLNYGRIKNNVRVQDARLQQTIENYQNSVLLAAKEVDDAAISVVKIEEQQQLLAESLASSERALKLSTSRYQEGYSDFQRVLDAQRSLAATSNNYIATKGARINAIIAFYKALGAGWTPVTSESAIDEDTRELMQQRTDWGDLLNTPLPEFTK
ncbi:MAG: efflux transporter outer membrane subunit [Pseudomonadales bacterium]